MELENKTLGGFNALCEEYVKAEAELERIKKEVVDPARLRLEDLESQILGILEENNLKTFKATCGAFTRVARFTVPVPKTIEQKKEFFKWLTSKGENVYWDYATVNSQKLNSLWKAEREVAIEEGNADFKVPGIGDPQHMYHLSKRKV